MMLKDVLLLVMNIWESLVIKQSRVESGLFKICFCIISIQNEKDGENEYLKATKSIWYLK